MTYCMVVLGSDTHNNCFQYHLDYNPIVLFNLKYYMKNWSIT